MNRTPADIEGNPADVDAWFPRGLVLGFLGGAIALVISSSVHYITGDAEVMILVWVSMGMAVAVFRLTDTQVLSGE